MQISNLISKPILSPAGESYGYVTDVRISRDYKKISCLICADREEEEFFLPCRAVLSIRDALIVSKARLSAPTGIPSPIGKTVYFYTGEALGYIADVVLSETEESLLVIASEGGTTTSPVSLAAVAETVVLYPSEKLKAAARKHATAKKATPNRSKKQPAKKKEPAEKQQEHSFVVLNGTNLLGRYVQKNVYDKTGALIATVGEKITPAILSRARRAGKLLALTVNTLTFENPNQNQEIS